MPMTPEEALVIYHAGPKTVVKTLCELSAVAERVKTLEKKIAKLSKNSSNSSKPPSSDDITKPKPPKKPKGKRKIGGQPGHPRHERPPFPEEEIDEVHDYTLTRCPECHGQVSVLDEEPRVIQQILNVFSNPTRRSVPKTAAT